MMSDDRQRAAVRTGCAGISVRRQGSEKGHRQAAHPLWAGVFSRPSDNIRIAWMRMVPPRRHTRAMERSKRGDAMRRQLTAVVSFAFVATSGAVLAHHSFAMFDQENPIELDGVVQEFKFTSPHSFII